MRDYFIYDGIDSRQFGIYAFAKDNDSASNRIYDRMTIPGRSGDILIDGKRYGSGSVAYSCIIHQQAERHLDDFRNFLLSRTGYRRLEDTIHKEEYYQAAYMETFAPIFDQERNRVKFTVSFVRKPQRFLKAGELPIDLSANATIYNPTYHPAQPLIRVYGAGTLGMGGETILIYENASYMDIDCEAMECFRDATSLNKDVRFDQNDFPTLHPGANGITLSGTISRVIITPRWYKL